MPFGLHVAVLDPTKLPALDVELRWSLFDATGTATGRVAAAGRLEDLSAATSSRAIASQQTRLILENVAGPHFAQVHIDGADECSGGTSSLFAFDTRSRVVWLNRIQGGSGELSEVVVHDLDDANERRFALDAEADRVRFVDAGNGRQAWLAHCQTFDPTTWHIEQVDYERGAREHRLTTRSDVAPRLHTMSGGRELVVASYRDSVWQLDLLLPLRAQPYFLGKSSAARDATAVVGVDPAGRALVWTEEASAATNSSAFVVTVIGPLGPSATRRVNAGQSIVDFQVSRDGERFGWITTSAEGARASLGVASLEAARALYFIPSPAEGHEVRAFRWSPRDDEIVAIGDLRTNEHHELILVRSDGRLHFSTSAAPPNPTEIDLLAWSPDGARFAWIERTAAGTRLLVTESLGLVTRVLSGSENEALDFAWSGDGREIAWRERSDSSTRLKRALADGSVVETLTIGGLAPHVEHYDFDPLSTRLVFVADGVVYLARLGEEAQRLSSTTGIAVRVAWSRFFGTNVSR